MKPLSTKSFIRRWLSVCALFTLVACGGSGSNVVIPIVFSTALTGAQETPPNSSPGVGIGILVFQPGDKSFTASVATTGVVDTIAHIHEGPPGVAGPVVFEMSKEPGSLVWQTKGTLTAAQEATLRAGNYYFNVHSPTYPEGEIRGQIAHRTPTDAQLQQLQTFAQQSQMLASQLRVIWAQRKTQAGTGAP